MARAAYGETLRCERCFSPYKIIGADNAPQKRLLCNECGYAQDVIVITRAEPVTRWTLVDPDGTVRSFASRADVIAAVEAAQSIKPPEMDPETPREPQTPRLELIESERDVSKRLDEEPTQDPPPVAEHDDPEPGEYVSIKDVVVAPVVHPEPEPDVPSARVSRPPPLPPDLVAAASVTEPALALPKIQEAADPEPITPRDVESLDPEDLDSEPPPPVVKTVSIPPPVPKKRSVSPPPPAAKVESEPPAARKSDLPSKLTKTSEDVRSDEELIKDAVTVANSDPPPPAKPADRVDAVALMSRPPPPPATVKSTPPPRAAPRKAEDQSKPKLPTDEEPVARQAPQPEAQQKSLLVPLLVIGAVSVGAWYVWSNSKANDTPVSTPTAEPTASAQPLPPPAQSAQPLASVPRLVVSAAPSASTSTSIAPPTTGVPMSVAPIALSLPELLTAASSARKKGDNAAAKDLYNKVLAQHPGNVEANAGLASIARAEGDLATARASYEKALATSPGFYPAIIGLADTEWELGDRAAAQQHYQQILRLPNTPPDRVRERAGVNEPPKPVTTSAPAPTSGAPPDSDRQGP